MVELKSIGEKRLEYLDLANKAWSGGEFETVQNFIDSFLTTVRDNTPVATEIQEAFDKAEKKKDETWKSLVSKTSSIDSQTQCEQRFYGSQDIALQALRERLNACWQTAIKHGMFND